jgi:hypothetical protein
MIEREEAERIARAAPGVARIDNRLIVTSMFIHAGLLHLAGNMLYLWIFGRHIEDNFGHLKFLVFYLICGVAAAMTQIAPDPDSLIPALGASGAIAGVLGAYLVMFPGNRIRVLLPLPNLLDDGAAAGGASDRILDRAATLQRIRRHRRAHVAAAGRRSGLSGAHRRIHRRGDPVLLLSAANQS